MTETKKTRSKKFVVVAVGIAATAGITGLAVREQKKRAKASKKDLGKADNAQWDGIVKYDA